MPNLRAETMPNGKVRYRYMNVLTRKTTTVGKGNKADAERIARQANAVIAQQILDQEAELILSGAPNGTGMTWDAWCDEYLLIQKQRLEAGLIKPYTHKQIVNRVKRVKKKFKGKRIHQLTTYDFTQYLKEDFLAHEKAGMAVMIRSTLIDICAEAISEGVLASDKGNPAQHTKPITRKTKRARLLLDVFNKALEWSKQNQQPYMWKAMLFAIATGQRRSDIAACQFNDIRKFDDDEYIGVIQGKTGKKVAIPLDLHLDSIGYSVRDVINLCRDRTLSRHLFHHSKSIGKTKAGGEIDPDTFSYNFADAIKAVKPDWGEHNPPTFHEIRSLAAREYDKQGIDIQKLLGHSQESTTAIYKDARGHDWVKVDLAENS
ncbi:MAG: tyrosine-type recombinase/integrase [Neptuniibacter sp.]|nr:tyrosine-type recombinase/integrase [Neptuniibacter sp.]